MDTEKALRELIARTCLSLDGNDFKSYLEQCDPAFKYRISAYSPEIRKDMIWLEKDKEGMKALFDLLPKQNMDRTPLTRHFSMYTVESDEQANMAKVVSVFQLYRTEQDGGVTSLAAVGKYVDKISLNDGRPLLLDREVRLDTRMLGKGYHVPF